MKQKWICTRCCVLPMDDLSCIVECVGYPSRCPNVQKDDNGRQMVPSYVLLPVEGNEYWED